MGSDRIEAHSVSPTNLESTFDRRLYDMARYDEGFLRAALIGYESEQAKIQAAITEIQARLGHRALGHPNAAADGEGHTAPKRPTLSASARRRIAAAQRKRWAALKNAETAPPKPKRKLSAAGRRAIIEATKKRWATIRAAKAKASGKPKASKAAKPRKAATQETTTA
jgi:hypothetical protein